MAISSLRQKILEKQGYRIVGEHSSTKTCMWCKSALRGGKACYKNTFYGIKSWRCIQASVTQDVCNLKCDWCWRDINYTSGALGKLDNPKEIVDGLVKEHKALLIGFNGNKYVNKERFEEAMNPIHIAISLTGDAVLYSKLPLLIDEIHNRGMTTFLVTNGTKPDMLRKLLDDHEPTQLYITVPAPNEEVFEKVCNPLFKGGWNKIKESLGLLNQFKRNVVRLTLVKGRNMFDEEGYSEMINLGDPMFLELKGYSWMGDSQFRLDISDMPKHEEIMEFSKKICELTDRKVIAEREDSRVALLMREDREDRFLKI